MGRSPPLGLGEEGGDNHGNLRGPGARYLHGLQDVGNHLKGNVGEVAQLPWVEAVVGLRGAPLEAHGRGP